MNKRQKFVRIQQTLLRRRDALRKSLSDELRQLNTPDNTGVGDSIDAALDGDYSEINSQLAQTESRELMRIEHALEQIRRGTYGTCEVCGGKIAAARLQALPYATMCIECQQRMEKQNRFDAGAHSWSSAGSSADDEDAQNDRLSVDRLDAVA